MDLHHLAEQLGTAFPEAAPVSPLTVLGEGFGSLVVETAGGIVFRIAKHPAAQRGHQRERLVLSVVQRTLSDLRVPRIAYEVRSSTAFPFGVIGYEKLPGRPLAPDDLDHETSARVAVQVAGFLTELHGINLSEATAGRLPTFPPPHDRLAALWENVTAFLARHLSRAEVRELRRWHGDLFDQAQRYPYAPVLVHGDLWYENMLFDEQQCRLVAIIDFENASIGDAAIDLATQGYLGDRFARAVIDAYYHGHPPPDLAGRLGSLMVLRELLGLEHGIVTGNVDADAIRKVTDAIHSNPGEPPSLDGRSARRFRRNAEGP